MEREGGADEVEGIRRKRGHGRVGAPMSPREGSSRREGCRPPPAAVTERPGAGGGGAVS